MVKTILISGSPRNGKTESILKEMDGELILLRNLKIKHCTGCLTCEKTHKCVIQDDMQALYPKLENADVIVIGTPNYFENVPGILKDFIDRTCPQSFSEKLKGKKLMPIIVGEMAIEFQKRVTKNALECFARAHNMILEEGKYFQNTLDF